MTELPRFLRRAPQILYVTAAMFFVAAVALNIIELRQTSAYSVLGDPLVAVAKLRVIYTSALDAIFIAANGLIVHALLMIWDRLAIAKPLVSDEQ